MAKVVRKRVYQISDMAEALAALPDHIKSLPVDKALLSLTSRDFYAYDKRFNQYRWQNGEWILTCDIDSHLLRGGQAQKKVSTAAKATSVDSDG